MGTRIAMVMLMSPRDRYVIVAAFDDSDAAAQVGTTAASVASRTPGAEVHLVHVLGSEKPADMQKHGAHVDAFARRLRQVFAGPIYGHLTAGTVWRAIVQTAANLNANLIIVAPHDRVGIERFAQGSVAEKVARHAHCPVLLQRPNTEVADRSTEIEPPCPQCLETQARTGGKTMWCPQHMQHHKEGHTYADYPESLESFSGGSMFFPC